MDQCGQSSLAYRREGHQFSIIMIDVLGKRNVGCHWNAATSTPLSHAVMSTTVLKVAEKHNVILPVYITSWLSFNATKAVFMLCADLKPHCKTSRILAIVTFLWKLGCHYFLNYFALKFEVEDGARD